MGKDTLKVDTQSQWTGRVLSGAAAAFSFWLGIILTSCTLLYIIPRTFNNRCHFAYRIFGWSCCYPRTLLMPAGSQLCSLLGPSFGLGFGCGTTGCETNCLL